MSYPSDQRNWPVGARVEARDAEWRIASVDSDRYGGTLLKCVGLSNIVRGRTSYFFTAYEKDKLKLLLPENTTFTQDETPNYVLSRLYIESILRTAPKTDNEKLYVSYKAAMDPLPYQFNPTLQALNQPRPRILIADAVGIGKTLEAGILTSELIARGRAKRILVLATKAVLPQFQQEFWNRFSIPLTALDSVGIQRVRNKLPSNQNPFFYFDKAIISIDTLKKDEIYREMISQAYWDLIVIDEAHNVAQRSNKSQRAKLAQLLSGRSDAMIMLTATPHDGKPESFASLLNILDPTAISDPKNYSPEDFRSKGLVIRRFKNDIKDQVSKEFPERLIEKREVEISQEEKDALRQIRLATFKTLDRKQKKDEKSEEEKGVGFSLFRTTIQKTFLSSPAASISLIKNRIKKLEEKKLIAGDDAPADIEVLKGLEEAVKKVTPEKFSKLKALKTMLNPKNSSIGWEADSKDRIVVFTESIVTLDFLTKELGALTGLKRDQIVTLSGSMTDMEISEKVNLFNQADSKVRVLLASDVASEGINLHHFSHRVIHFDIPWSLMTFQQRNGRIDRYGQELRPEIYYLLSNPGEGEDKGEMRVLEVLIEKDRRAQENLNDPLEFLSQKEQENRTGAAIEAVSEGKDFDEDFFSGFMNDEDSESGEEKIMGDPSGIAPVLTKEEYERIKAKSESLFKDDFSFASEGLRFIGTEQHLTSDDLKIENGLIDLQPTADLMEYLKYLPPEIFPDDNHFKLSPSAKAIQESMKVRREEGSKWPQYQLLWSNHPIMEWLEGRFLTVFGRNSVPLIKLDIPEDESWILLQGGFPNRRGYIPVHRFVAVRFKGGEPEVFTLKDLVRQLGLDQTLYNDGKPANTENMEKLLPKALDIVRAELKKAKGEYENREKPKLEEKKQSLEALRQKHEKVILEQGAIQEKFSSRQKEKINVLNAQFKAAEEFEKNNVELEELPFIQVVAAFTGN